MRLPSTLESWLIRTGGAVLARGGSDARLLIMIFHRVLPEPDPLLPDEPDAASFAAVMDLIAGGFRALPLVDAVARLREGTLPSRSICITFDDGYANNLEVAQPILAARGVPATVFVAPGFLGGGRMFNDTIIETVRRAPDPLDLASQGFGVLPLPDVSSRIRAYGEIIKNLKYLPPAERLARANGIADCVGIRLPEDLMMTVPQVRRLHSLGVDIGAHTMSHPILSCVSDQVAREEIVSSKSVLEEIISAPVRSFAYPNGAPSTDYRSQHAEMVRDAGFDFALTTAWGSAGPAADPFQLPRVAPWDASPLKYGLRLLRAYGQRARLTT